MQHVWHQRTQRHGKVVESTSDSWRILFKDDQIWSILHMLHRHIESLNRLDFLGKHCCLPAHGELASLVRFRWSSWSPKLSETELCQSECQARNRLNIGNFTEKSVNTGNIAFLMLFRLFARSVLSREFIWIHWKSWKHQSFRFTSRVCNDLLCVLWIAQVSGADNSMFLLWCLAVLARVTENLRAFQNKVQDRHHSTSD